MKSLLSVILLLAAACGGGAWWWFHREPASSPAEPEGPVFFREITAEVGLDYRIELEEPERYFFPDIMGGGAAFLDYDGDGDLDLLFVNALAPLEQPPAPERNLHRLYRQETDGTLEDVSVAAGLKTAGTGQGLAVGDVNNDGRPDVYISNFGPDQLFLNQGDGTFSDITAGAGIVNPLWGTSACFVDVNRDGFLDLFVTNYVDYNPSQPCIEPSGVQDFCSPLVFPGTGDRLFLNITGESGGAVQFRDISLSAGISARPGTGLGVVSLDANGDRWPDIYVANDGHANHLWINQQDNTFQEQAILYGAAYDPLGRARAGMGIAPGDVNGDLTEDLLVTHLDGESNGLFLLHPDRVGFEEASLRFDLARDSFPRTGFGCVLVDLDHDGWLDLAVANGRVKRALRPPSAPGNFWASYAEPAQLFFHTGKQFQVARSDRDEFLRHVGVSRALAMGDMDRDGDMDLLITHLGGPARLFRNEAPKRGNWLQVVAVEPRYGGRPAYGARVEINAGGRRQAGLLNPGSSYLTSHEPVLHFGLGDAAEVTDIRVIWPDGVEERFVGSQLNQRVTLPRGQGRPE